MRCCVMKWLLCSKHSVFTENMRLLVEVEDLGEGRGTDYCQGPVENREGSTSVGQPSSVLLGAFPNI